MVQQLVLKGLFQQVESAQFQGSDSGILICESRNDDDFQIVTELRNQVQTADAAYENIEQDYIAPVLPDFFKCDIRLNESVCTKPPASHYLSERFAYLLVVVDNRDPAM